MLRVWSCILGCLGFLLDGWPILPMFFCLLCVVSSYLTMKNSNMEAEAMKIRISTGRGAAAMHALLSATKKKAALPDAFRCRRANPDCWVLPVSFDRSMWQNGRHNGTTVLTCEANRMQKRSDQSLPYPAGPRQAVPCPKNSGFWPAKLRFVYWQRCFFTSKHSDLPGENSGFWRQTWKDFFLFASNYWDATLLHYSCNQNFGTLSAKKTLAFTFWFCIIPLAQKWILPAKIEFQPAEAETSHARVVNGDVFFCLPCWSESWLLQLAAKT